MNPSSRNLRATLISVSASLAVASAWGQAPFEPPSEATVDEARSLVRGMIENPRGPYSRIRWFCNDGTVQPPVAYACRDRGGGRQHGEFSQQRQRLADIGWAVGTIFVALPWEELWDADRRHHRLRELALERYLIDTSEGWVLRGAANYRGRVQIEGEEAAGRALLLRLLSDPDWISANYLLTRESVRIIPHGGAADDRTREIRRAAVDIAEREASFDSLRVEVHSAPTVVTASRIQEWASRNQGEAAALATELAARLEELYGASGRRARLAEQRALLVAQPSTGQLADSLTIENLGTPLERVSALSIFLRDARRSILAVERPGTRLLLFDVINEIEADLNLIAAEALRSETLSRGELLVLADALISASFGAGFIAAGEYSVLQRSWGTGEARSLSLPAYAERVAYLRRIPQWAAGSVRYTFAEPLIWYTALDRRAAAFVDDLLRSSPLTPLAEITRRVARDLGRLTGITQYAFGETAVGAFGLNPGLAVGPLVILDSYEDAIAGAYRRADIVLLPETVAELTPVAGIITLGEGNPLSHVQLLARNFGIPNVSISPTTLPQIRSAESRDILVAVGSDGSFVMAHADSVAEDVLELIGTGSPGSQLTVPRPDLSMRRVLPLSELNAGLSGRWVGPKAANLGELARLFPGRVAPAVAVPFGVFAEHMDAGTPSLRQRLVAAYEQRRRGESDEAGLAEELASIRRDIAALSLSAEYRQRLARSMTELFGEPGSYGVFVRSDTNVEDLPQFTGAGLSETLPNVVAPELQINGISRVWASVLSPRAIAWRSNLLTNPEEVYASVLLMKSVPAEKSGVLVTADLSSQNPGLTVSTAWGVGGAVAGEAAETLILQPDGRELLVSEAKVAYQRRLNDQGGISWRPAPDGPVLTENEKTTLRALAAEVISKYAPVLDEEGQARPWDIEFGFVAGELALFQIRPLVERGPRLADRVLRALDAQPVASTATEVLLSAQPLRERNQ